MKIYDIGYGQTRINNFIEALNKAKVKTLVDIRSKPYSRNKDFTKHNLRRTLHSNQIGYRWMPTLGGKEGVRAKGWFTALQELMALAKSWEPICVMCMERDPSQCHRGRWLEPDLKTHDVILEHLFPYIDIETKPTLDHNLDEW